MLNFLIKHELKIFFFVFALTVFAAIFGGLRERNIRLSHKYAVSSSGLSGKVYYIDDYTIEDGSIIFSIDGVEYHFSNYSIREIEK